MKSTPILLAFLLASCIPATVPPASAPPQGQAQGQVFFSAEPLPGGAYRLALDNGAAGAIGYNLCASELQRLDGATWRPVPSDDACTMQLMTLNPGHDATFEKRTPSGLAAGEYRYATWVENPLGSPRQQLVTGAFKR